MGVTSQPSRSSTPPVTRLQKSKSSIVSFTRPGSSRRESGEEAGGFKFGSLDEAPSSAPQPIPFNKAGPHHARSFNLHNLSDSAASFTSLPPLRRPDCFVTTARTCVEGFNAPESDAQREHRSPTGHPPRRGLLSRQLNGDSASNSPSSWDDSQASALKEKLEKCLRQSPSLPTTPLLPDSVHLAQDVMDKLKSALVQRAYQDHSVRDAEFTSRLTSMLLHMADVRCTLVKLASSLHTLRKMGALPEAQQQRIAHGTLQVLTPLANRLGVWSLKAEMEDLCFKALHPAEHAELKAKLRGSQEPAQLQQSLDAIKLALETSSVAHHELSGRPKNLYGVFRKMEAKGYGIDQIYDVRALRIIVDSKTDCYRAMRAVHKLFAPMREHKDYIKSPKGNGYQSLHTVVRGPDGVPIEVQIRTAKMHMLAEFGMAAHWRYKEQLAISKDFDDTFINQQVAWARFCITWQLELQDKKFRPSGSPPRDNSLAAIASQVTAGCIFPEHKPSCGFAAYMQRGGLAPLPRTEQHQAELPVHIVMFNNVSPSKGSMSIESVPPRCTAGQLTALLHKGGLGPAVPVSVRILVNQEEVHDASTLLQHGDKVEIFRSEFAPAPSPVRPWAPPQKLERERQRLARIYSKSASKASMLAADLASDLADLASDTLGLDMEELGTEFVKVDPMRRQGSGFAAVV
ncbi:hypothetical protein WJX72_004985 [[Myrmecia] bisecta]|uniref:RelA/SpoT domain-containing protein n=1 Tax=[Myrmecia] bisecta TaxID=41462 RepID=A0AAW1QQM2_9CHLO